MLFLTARLACLASEPRIIPHPFGPNDTESTLLTYLLRLGYAWRTPDHSPFIGPRSYCTSSLAPPIRHSSGPTHVLYPNIDSTLGLVCPQWLTTPEDSDLTVQYDTCKALARQSASAISYYDHHHPRYPAGLCYHFSFCGYAKSSITLWGFGTITSVRVPCGRCVLIFCDLMLLMSI